MTRDEIEERKEQKRTHRRIFIIGVICGIGFDAWFSTALNLLNELLIRMPKSLGPLIPEWEKLPNMPVFEPWFYTVINGWLLLIIVILSGAWTWRKLRMI